MRSADYSEGNRQSGHKKKKKVPTVGGFERTLRFGPPEGMGAPPPPSQISCQHLLISAADLVPDMSRRVEWCSLPPLPYLPPPLSQMGHLQHLPLPHLAALQLHAACQPKPQIFTDCKTGSMHLVTLGGGGGGVGAEAEGRRPRGEKRPTPEGHKDDKYFERRKRNNQAAKKSRDARKFREDQIALRAMLLEQENRLLRAQLAALREEARALLLR